MWSFLHPRAKPATAQGITENSEPSSARVCQMEDSQMDTTARTVPHDVEIFTGYESDQTDEEDTDDTGDADNEDRPDADNEDGPNADNEDGPDADNEDEPNVDNKDGPNMDNEDGPDVDNEDRPDDNNEGFRDNNGGPGNSNYTLTRTGIPPLTSFISPFGLVERKQRCAAAENAAPLQKHQKHKTPICVEHNGHKNQLWAIRQEAMVAIEK